MEKHGDEGGECPERGCRARKLLVVFAEPPGLPSAAGLPPATNPPLEAVVGNADRVCARTVRRHYKRKSAHRESLAGDRYAADR